jgi:hypothetical protein
MKENVAAAIITDKAKCAGGAVPGDDAEKPLGGGCAHRLVSAKRGNGTRRTQPSENAAGRRPDARPTRQERDLKERGGATR